METVSRGRDGDMEQQVPYYSVVVKNWEGISSAEFTPEEQEVPVSHQAPRPGIWCQAEESP